MKITILSKPEEKKSQKGTRYWSAKVADENGEEKHGNIFGDTEPQIDQVLEVDEKYNDEYKNYTWFQKREKKGLGGGFKPSLSVDQQIRVVALQEAVKGAGLDSKSTDIVKVAAFFETYIRGGKA